MLPFRVDFNQGEPPYEQLVFHIKKAIAEGHLKAGDKIPSVRTFSKELRINPNTVQKALSVLIGNRILEVQSGIGSIVSAEYSPTPEEQDLFLRKKLDTIIIEAKSLGISKAQFKSAVNEQWK